MSPNHQSSPLDSRAEHALLLHCARTRVGAERAGQIRALTSGGIDWEYLLETAQRHRVLPLLCQNLSAVCPDAVPAEVLAELKQRYLANAQRSLFLTGELRSILDQFERAGLKSMPYKGPVLAASVYGNLALRQFCDLDILVPPDDVPAACQELVTLGYEPQDHLDPAREAFCRRFAYAYGFVHPQKKVLVELHWTVLPRWFRVPFDTSAMWARSGCALLAGRTVAVPCAEDLLLMLCLHGAKEAWGDLGWICDLGELIQQYELNWQGVFTTASRSACEPLLRLGLLLARNLLSAPVPAAVLDKACSDPVVREVAGSLQEQFFNAQDSDARIASIARLNLRTQRGSWDKWRCRFSMALVPGVYDVSSVRLPQLLFPLYHVVRPARLLRKYGLRLLGRA